MNGYSTMPAMGKLGALLLDGDNRVIARIVCPNHADEAERIARDLNRLAAVDADEPPEYRDHGEPVA